jgi:hypothetical protein
MDLKCRNGVFERVYGRGAWSAIDKVFKIQCSILHKEIGYICISILFLLLAEVGNLKNGVVILFGCKPIWNESRLWKVVLKKL